MSMVTNRPSRCAAPSLPIQGFPDPIQLHAEAHNALAMALHYLRQPSGNVRGASRKVVQALGALRRLQSECVKTSGSPCANCRDNFPLPQALDSFDATVIKGYVERRTACDRCAPSVKPCLEAFVQGGAA